MRKLSGESTPGIYCDTNAVARYMRALIRLGIQLNGLLEVIDGLLVVVILVGFHTLVELIAGAKFVAAHRGEERQRNCRQRQ